MAGSLRERRQVATTAGLWHAGFGGHTSMSIRPSLAHYVVVTSDTDTRPARDGSWRFTLSLIGMG